jgi:tRNA pseudouridine55 synthase
MSGIKRNLGRVDGVLPLDKPQGITSQAAVTKARHLLSALKAGHTGTLDPMASGLLPICFGEATKFSQLLLDGDKGYAATIKLGMKTTTGDLEGEVTARSVPACSESDIRVALQKFRGAGMQMPPMYSALKHAGQPLYKYARAGREIAREARPIRISALDFVDFIDDELRINVSCSKGTYIRVLAEDIGNALGCGACLSALRRTAVGDFRLDDAITLEALAAMSPGERKARLLPVDSLVAMLPRTDLDRQQARLIAHGQIVAGHCDTPEGLTRIYGPDQDFLGIAEIRAPGHLVARRLLAQPGGDQPAASVVEHA